MYVQYGNKRFLFLFLFLFLSTDLLPPTNTFLEKPSVPKFPARSLDTPEGVESLVE